MSSAPFSHRHIGTNASETAAMLQDIGVASLDQLIDETVPASIRLPKALDLPQAMAEQDYLRELESTAAMNRVFRSYIGMGYHDTITPGVILRNIFENPGWYTAYTPYQAEIAQGRLEALLNYQTMVLDLTGMEIANASLLDEATAAAEAMHVFFATRSRESVQRNANKLFVSTDCLPQTIDVLKTRSAPLGIELVIGDHRSTSIDGSYFGAILQYPGINGNVESLSDWTAKAKSMDIQVAVAADLLALTLLVPPESGEPTSYSATASDWVYPWDTAALMQLSSQRRKATSVKCLAVSSACPSTAMAIGRCAWRYRPGNSTSVARKPPLTFAPRKYCWPSWPVCMPFITVPMA